MRHGSLVFALAAVVGACSGGPVVQFESPPRDAFVADGDDLRVQVRADGYDELLLSVDGGDPVSLLRDGAGKFVATLPLAPGRHRLAAVVPGVAGAVDERVVSIGRAPQSPIDGFGLSDSGREVLLLSDGSPSDDGFFAGRLSVLNLTTSGASVARDLTNDGVYGEVTDEGRVTWVDGWKNEHGTLHLAERNGPETVTVKRARDFKFARDGRTLGVLDDGVVVVDPFTDVVHRVAEESRVFVFSGPGNDVVSFDGETGNNARRVTFASAPDYAPVILVTPVLPVIASNPTRREAAIAGYDPAGPGTLVLYDFEAQVVDRPFDAVGAFTWSRDGNWLLALTEAFDGLGSVGIQQRSVPGAPTIVLDGSFSRAGFDESASRVFALEPGVPSVLYVASLADDPPVLAPLLIQVADFLALPDDRMLLLTVDSDLVLVEADDSYTTLGRWNEDNPEVSLSQDGATFAFTSVDGARKPIRRVNLLTGDIGDLGEDARRPSALNGGAVAWAERSGADSHDLWILPTFPAAISGPRPLLADVDVGKPFAFSPDGERFAAVAGDRVFCGDAGAHMLDLGLADTKRRDVFFLGDGRVGRFGLDGSEDLVFFVQPCAP